MAELPPPAARQEALPPPDLRAARLPVVVVAILPHASRNSSNVLTPMVMARSAGKSLPLSVRRRAKSALAGWTRTVTALSIMTRSARWRSPWAVVVRVARACVLLVVVKAAASVVRQVEKVVPHPEALLVVRLRDRACARVVKAVVASVAVPCLIPRKDSKAWTRTAMAAFPKKSTSKALKKCARCSVGAVVRVALA